MAVPAEGPSFGVAPSVKWRWTAYVNNYFFCSSVKNLCALIFANLRDSYNTVLILPDAVIYPFLSGSLSSKQLSTVNTWPIIPPTVNILT